MSWGIQEIFTQRINEWRDEWNLMVGPANYMLYFFVFILW